MKLKPAYILLPIAALVGIGLLAQKKAAGLLNYFIKSVAITFEGITPMLKVNVAVQNPSNEQFVISSISGNCLIEDQVIGNFSMFQQIVLNPNSETVLPLIVRLSALAIVSDLITLIVRGSGIPKTIKLLGTVNANNVLSELSLSYKIT